MEGLRTVSSELENEIVQEISDNKIFYSATFIFLLAHRLNLYQQMFLCYVLLTNTTCSYI